MLKSIEEIYYIIDQLVQKILSNRSANRYLELILQVPAKINATAVQSFCIVDSTALPVNGYNRKDTKWATDSSGKSKNMHGWYQGFKLHLIINQSFLSVLLKPMFMMFKY